MFSTLLIWLLPVPICWLLAIFDFQFSALSRNAQLKNLDLIGMMLFVGLLTSVCASTLTLGFLNSLSLSYKATLLMFNEIGGFQIILPIVLTVFCSYGVFHSFGGTIFDKDYSRVTRAFLGIGAWSVILSFFLSILLGYLSRVTSIRL